MYMYACKCVYACMDMCKYIHLNIYMCVVCIYAYICTMVPWYHRNSRAVEGYGILVYIETSTKIYQFICFFDGGYGVVLIYIHEYIYIYSYIHIYIYIHKYIYIYKHIHVYIFIYIYVPICMYMCMYACIYKRIYAYTYVYMQLYI